jgi:formylglycine-generating enzyme required for sulfatase activity
MNSLHYRYSGSNHAGEAGWYEVNSEDKTQPVGQKKPNETGIYDMSGNTREWCWDRYDKDYYKTSPPDNPKGPAPGKNRSYRGGGICDRIIWLRTTARFNLPPETKSCELGFRIIKKNTGNSNPPAGMVFVEGGAFNMGNNKGSSGEKLVHDVTVSSFYMGKFEVTQEEWKPVMGNNPSYRKGNPCPVNLINWYDAVEYCNKRSRKEGFKPCYSGSGDQIACNFDADGYRLPTEAEWEYAARGGIQSRHFKFSGSNDAGEVAWYLKNLIVYFQPVGEKKPNELGIYDMSGNMWEMCWDWYDIDYYKNSPAKNPKGPLSGIRRIIRGGSWLDPEDKLGCTLRSAIVPYRKAAHLGIRVVRTAK